MQANQNQNKVVYDCMDPSPYYEGEGVSQTYIDEKDLVELPPLLSED